MNGDVSIGHTITVTVMDCGSSDRPIFITGQVWNTCGLDDTKRMMDKIREVFEKEGFNA